MIDSNTMTPPFVAVISLPIYSPIYSIVREPKCGAITEGENS